MTQADYAFTAFLATSTRERMTPIEQTMYDFFATGVDPVVEAQISAYKKRRKAS